MRALPFRMRDDANEFETEEKTVVYTPEQWSAEECTWMLLQSERIAARKAREESSNAA